MRSIGLGSNIESLRAQRRLGESSSALGSTFERLSSGQRINRASDDAAGLAIAMNLNVSARVAGQGIRNINDGISAINIAEGAISQLGTIVVRQRELSEQAANGTFSRQQRLSLQSEANALAKEFNRIVQTTSFNGRQLLDATQDSIRIQMGEGLNGSIAQRFTDGLQRNIGTGSFSESASITTGQPQGAVSYDANGDGNADIVSLLGGGAAAEVRLGNGDGTFRAGTSYAVGAASPNDFTTGDFNEDGVMDLAVVSESTQNLIVLIGNSNGSFSAGNTFSIAGATDLRHVRVGDVNNDGNLDAITTSFADDKWAVSLGNGNGSFRAGTVYTGTDMLDQEFALGDIDGNGTLDIIISTGDFAASEHSRIMYGNGNGTFGAQVTIGIGINTSAAISVGDFNRDGLLDIVVNETGSNQSSILLNNGNGTFSKQVYSYGVSGGGNISIADVNGDGFDDILNGFYTSGVTKLMFGNGDGTFKSYNQVHSVAQTNSVSISDFNNDGVLDFLTTANGGTMHVMLQGAIASSGIAELNLSTQENAREALNTTEATLQRISSGLGFLGSFQSRLGVAARTLQVSEENLRGAAGRILDADIAQETASLTRLSILQQTGAAVLAQANIQPQLALRLISG